MSKDSLLLHSINGVSSTLDKVHVVVDATHPVISEVVVIVARVEGYIGDALSFVKVIDNVLWIFHQAVQLLAYLGQLIPTVGTILSRAAKAVQDWDIETKVRTILDRLVNIVNKARDGVLKELKVAATNVMSQVSALKEQVPAWSETVNIMGHFVELAEIAIACLTGKSSNEVAKAAIEKLMSLTGGLDDKLKPIISALQPLKEFLQGLWETLRVTIVQPLESGFKSILELFEPFTATFKNCINVCQTIKQWFEPFFWVLNAIQWVFDHTVGWLIERVKTQLGLDMLMDNIIAQVTANIGVNKIEEIVRKLFEEDVGKLLRPLKSIQEATGLASIAQTTKEYGDTLRSLRQNPAGELAKVVFASKGLIRWSAESERLKKRRVNRAAKYRTRQMSPGSRASTNAASDYEITSFAISSTHDAKDEVVAVIQRHQSMIDDFVRLAGSRPASERNRKTTTTAPDRNDREIRKLPSLRQQARSFKRDVRQDHSPASIELWARSPEPNSKSKATPKFAPPFDFARLNGQPVSVLLRTIQGPVIERQSSHISKPLCARAPVSTETRLPSDAGEPLFPDRLKNRTEITQTTHTAPDDGTQLSVGFTTYCEKYEVLLSQADSAKKYLTSMIPPAEQADTVFASHTTVTSEFCSHFIALLGGLDPLFDATLAVLATPMKYKTALTSEIKTLIGTTSASEAVSEFIHGVYTVLESAHTIIEKVRGERNDLVSVCAKFDNTYKASNQTVGRICSPDRFLQSHGPDINSLSKLIVALGQRVDTTMTTFTVIHELGKTIIDNQSKLAGDKTKLFSLMDNIYSDLLPRLESTINDLRQYSISVEAVYDSLLQVHKDAQLLFQVTAKLSDECKKIEAKVIAADWARDVCVRINANIGPFEGILAEMGINPDTPAPAEPEVPHPSGGIQMPIGGTFMDNLAGLAVDGLEILLEKFFHLSENKQAFSDLTEALQQPFNDHMTRYDAELLKLVDLVHPKRTTKLNVPVERASGHETYSFDVANPLLDDDGSKSLQDILQEVIVLAQAAKMKPETRVEDMQVVTPTWARPKDDLKPIVDVFILTGARIWDQAEPSHPSKVWMNWYEVLERLDSVMKDRAVVQMNGSDSTVKKLKGGSLELWHLLATSAKEGGRRYERLLRDFTLPLRHCVERLAVGVKQLTGEEDPTMSSFLKSLPSAEYIDPAILRTYYTAGSLPPLWTLPEPALNILNSTFVVPESPMPAPLRTILDIQERLEYITLQTRPLLIAYDSKQLEDLNMKKSDYKERKETVRNAISCLDIVHHENNLLASGRLLEATADQNKARQYVDAVGSTEYLDNVEMRT